MRLLAWVRLGYTGSLWVGWVDFQVPLFFEPPFQFPPASVYYNISYPFPPPSLPINITLTPQQLLLILTRLPVPLQHMFVASISYHIIPGRMVTRNNTCFMQAIETAMQGEHVEQVRSSHKTTPLAPLVCLSFSLSFLLVHSHDTPWHDKFFLKYMDSMILDIS